MAEKNEHSLVKGSDQLLRCWWCGDDPLYVHYHDQQWGRPESEDRALFEKICLEGFQAGLSWLTILRKRDSFRQAFENFQFARVAEFDRAMVDQLTQNAAIVRHRGKIESTINNARRALQLASEFGSLATYFWQFTPRKRTILRSRSDVLGMTAESTAMSKDLKRRGWSFVGPTTCYAFMQSMGLVNDHLHGCHFYRQVHQQRKRFEVPQSFAN